jgi:arsenate reductase
MNEEECLKLLSTDGMLVKRPLLITDGVTLVGVLEPVTPLPKPRKKKPQV